MTLYQLIKEYSNSSEKTMWGSVKTISDYIDDKLTDEQKDCLNRCVYGIISGGHYNSLFAEDDINKMWFKDVRTGNDIHGPFVLYSRVNANNKNNIPKEYNSYDYWVTCNMLYSDNYNLLKEWFPDITNEEIEKKVYELADNWLNDSDNPYGTSKIWGYFNSKKK